VSTTRFPSFPSNVLPVSTARAGSMLARTNVKAAIGATIQRIRVRFIFPPSGTFAPDRADDATANGERQLIGDYLISVDCS
jgi:hypothetical protein